MLYPKVQRDGCSGMGHGLATPGVKTRKTSFALCLGMLILGGCSSATVTDDSGAPYPYNLAKGQCPASIIAINGPRDWDRSRYGSGVSYPKMQGYRDREIDNCQALLGAGDKHALAVLEDYWKRQGNVPRLVTSYQTYLDTGADPGTKRRLAVELSELYSNGSGSFRPNAKQALIYLGLAVAYGEERLRPAYADMAYRAADYEIAVTQYKRLLNNPDRALPREQRCEERLRLGYLYFAGLGTGQNSYLGYYHWQRGLELADGAHWGSCLKDNFVNQKRYRQETDRKQFVDPLINALSPLELDSLRQALRKPYAEGERYVAAMNYQPTAVARLAANGLAPVRPGSSSQRAGWPTWAPLSGGVCAMQTASAARSWADVFRDNSASVWTLTSRQGDEAQMGSAVAVSANTLLTNCHMINNPALVELQNASGKRAARVVSADTDSDRCILLATETTQAFVSLARSYSDLQIGEEVSAVGSPKGMSNSLSRGIIAGKRTRNGRALIQTDAALSTGSSGGGLFDMAGNLIGITTFQIPDGDRLNFAIAVTEFCRR